MLRSGERQTEPSHPSLCHARRAVRCVGINRPPRDLTPTELARVATEAAAGTGVTIEVESPAGLHVQGDGGRLRQVLLNLVANAARAGAPLCQT